MEQRPSKEYAWRYVTADQVLSCGPCELLFAYLVVSAASTDSYLYDGDSDSGDLITPLVSATARGHPFSPKAPIYCRKGLYVDVGTNVTGILVQWRELGHKGGS